MKIIILSLLLLLSGCANYQLDEYGNYNDVVLTASESQVIASDVANFLRRTDTAKRIVNINHDNSEFATTLIDTLRKLGVGVSVNNPNAYLNMNYRLVSLNQTQFYITASFNDGRHFSRIWVISNNQLIPLPSRAAFGGSHG